MHEVQSSLSKIRTARVFFYVTDGHMVLHLALLPPELVRAAVAETVPAGRGLVRLSDPPLVWTSA